MTSSGTAEPAVAVLDLDGWYASTAAGEDDLWRSDGVHFGVDPSSDISDVLLGAWLVSLANEAS